MCDWPRLSAISDYSHDTYGLLSFTLICFTSWCLLDFGHFKGRKQEDTLRDAGSRLAVDWSIIFASPTAFTVLGETSVIKV